MFCHLLFSSLRFHLRPALSSAKIDTGGLREESGALVPQVDCATAERSSLTQAQFERRIQRGKIRLAAAHHDRVHDQPVFIYQAQSGKPRSEAGAADAEGAARFTHETCQLCTELSP